jgi:hypothetical protein
MLSTVAIQAARNSSNGLAKRCCMAALRFSSPCFPWMDLIWAFAPNDIKIQQIQIRMVRMADCLGQYKDLKQKIPSKIDGIELL